MTLDQKSDAQTKLEEALKAFDATPEKRPGQVLAEVAAAIEDVSSTIVDELLADVDASIASASALMDDADAEAQQGKEEDSLDAVRKELEELP